MDILEFNRNVLDSILPERKPTAHKGDFGKILLLCGSRGYTGAAALSAMGSLRVGSGLVYLGVPSCIYEIEATKLLEPIVLPLPDANGMFSASTCDEVSGMIDKMDAILIGPGIGKSKDTEQLVIWLLENFNGPLVIDADGISSLKTHIDILRGRTHPLILTPHEGEFAQMMGRKCLDRLNDAIIAAKEFYSIVVLKGHRTVITDGETVYINTTGNPGLAVGGSGDVLAGMITGLLGQGLNAIQAAAAAVWLHGTAGDICAQQIGTYGMLPSDMLDVIPRLLK